MPGKRWTKDEDQKARDLLEESRDLSVVADIIGRSRNSVMVRNQRRWKIRVPHTGGDNFVPNEEFVESWTPALFLQSIKDLLTDKLGTKGSVVTNQVIWPHRDSVSSLEWMFEVRGQVPHLARNYETYKGLIDARREWDDRRKPFLIHAIKKELPKWQ